MEFFEVNRALCVVSVSQNGHWKPLLAFKILECSILQKKSSFSVILLEENVLKCHALNYVCILHYVLHVIYYCKYSDSSYSLLTSAEGFFSGLMQQH
jgi:hypothetical protein